MSKIISISTAVPEYKHDQQQILSFMQNVFAMDETDKRKLKFLYHQSNIKTRYSVIPDYSLNAPEWSFYPATENLQPFPSLEKRMKWFNKYAPALSINAIEKCIDNKIRKEQITHLITVSCTGMSAPGLDLQIAEEMQLPSNINRTSINFMGCYAAVHALKLADAFCKADTKAKVMIVCTELCTLHFQKENNVDNITSSLLFGDGSAAVLVVADNNEHQGLTINKFYSEISYKGKKDMSWELSSTGFLMNLSGYVPDLIKENFNSLLTNALNNAAIKKESITHWCLHPGGKKILENIKNSVNIPDSNMKYSYDVLEQYGNMSSPTILFVLKEIFEEMKSGGNKPAKIFGAAFGPGLTMETFILSND